MARFQIEGYWRERKNDQSDLPFPKARKSPWRGQRAFLAALAAIETVAKRRAFRGLSYCRLCRKRNGHIEFAFRGWHWPQGFRHYVEQHNVRPSKDFIAFVLNEQPMPKTRRRLLGRHIVSDPAICHGKPTFRGTRIMVDQVLRQVAEGMPGEAISAEWRGAITKEAIAEAVRLAVRLP